MNRGAAGVVLILVACAVIVAGCAGGGQQGPASVARGDAPAFAAVAAAYNERVSHFGELWARSVVRLTYRDEDGAVHNEQGEGLMQVVRPDRFAMSIKKAGKMLFWMGCDPERYWWIDVIQDKAARVGRHDGPGSATSEIAVSPLDVVSLLGIVPIDAELPGATQWSSDGSLLGVTFAVQGGGVERLWLDPGSYEAQKAELYDSKRTLVVVADLGAYGPVEVSGYGGARPRIATMIDAYHPASRTRMRLDLAGMRNTGVVPDAFDFDALVRELGVERVIDLDAKASDRGEEK